MTTEALVKKQYINDLKKICRGFKLATTGLKEEVANRVIDHFGVRPDYAAIWEAEKDTILCKADLSRKGISIGLLRFVCAENKIETKDGEGNNLEKNLLLGPLVLSHDAEALSQPADEPGVERPRRPEPRGPLPRIVDYSDRRMNGRHQRGRAVARLVEPRAHSGEAFGELEVVQHAVKGVRCVRVDHLEELKSLLVAAVPCMQLLLPSHQLSKHKTKLMRSI